MKIRPMPWRGQVVKDLSGRFPYEDRMLNAGHNPRSPLRHLSLNGDVPNGAKSPHRPEKNIKKLRARTAGRAYWLLKRIQMTTQLAARMKHPRLHRTHRTIAQVRDLLNGMAPVVGQQETQSLFVG